MTDDPIELHRFHGGICPATEKSASTAMPIQYPPLANRFIIPIQQQGGEPGRLLVAPGDYVKKGQILVAATQPMSVAIHAPTSGSVHAIEPHPVSHPSGLTDRCILIDPDGLDLSEAQQGIASWLEASPRVLLEKIRWAGIVGLGGAGFPTDLKLSGINLHTLIINGAECEPYISADDMLMRERAAEVLQGVLMLLTLTGAKRCLVGIEDDKPQAISAMKQALTDANNNPVYQIRIVEIPTRYPSGGEKQLIQILTGQEVPSGQLPSSLGILCQNVGTVYAVYRAIAKGEPLISRITTLAGGALATPMNVEAPLGTPIGHLLNFAGLKTQDLDQILIGGPLMGVPIPSLETPISKTSNCVLATSVGEFAQPEPEQPCIRCGYCADVCPAKLLPQQLYWFTRSQEWQKAQRHHLFDCIECGACAFVCPSRIPLVQYYRFGKSEIRQLEQASLKSDRARERFNNRQQRLEREHAERAAKRKARVATAQMVDEVKMVAVQPEVFAQPTASLQQSEQWLALEKKLRMTQDRVEQARERLAIARSQGLDTEPALERALQKQLDKQADLERQRSQLIAGASESD